MTRGPSLPVLGMTERMCLVLGLHVESMGFSLEEQEVRRRVWYVYLPERFECDHLHFPGGQWPSRTAISRLPMIDHLSPWSASLKSHSNPNRCQGIVHISKRSVVSCLPRWNFCDPACILNRHIHRSMRLESTNTKSSACLLKQLPTYGTARTANLSPTILSGPSYGFTLHIFSPSCVGYLSIHMPI